MTTVLIGGGWSDPGAVYGPFLAAAGSRPRVACVVVDEGDGADQAARSAIREHVAAGGQHAGFSAGAAVTARRAVVGGYRLDGRVVCPDDAGEDLEEITVVDGLGLIDVAIDVHAAQRGTLSRLCAAIGAGLVPRGVAIDEDTAVVLVDGAAQVVGHGAVHLVERDEDGGVVLRTAAPGDHVALPGVV